MSAPFKVLIIGGGIAGLSLAVMLEEYGFEYELLEKHADVAPKLGAGVGLTPNGARILDQLGLWKSMCEHGSPVNAGTALSPQGETVIYNPNMGTWLEKLYGYKIHFLSRHDCLRILLGKIQRKSSIHLLKEVTKIDAAEIGKKARVETADGSVYTADIVIGADGVRSNTRTQMWRIADAEKPGYIPKSDRTGIVSFYTAVIGIAHDPGLPKGGSARAYNDHRSYFFQEGREGSGEFFWWLCTKNEKTKKGIIPKLSNDKKEDLLQKYTKDKIGHGVTLGSLYSDSIYSAIIPLQEFVLEKCFYKNILLIGDSFRKLHPVAGQGANSAIEESAFVADILWNLREKSALHDQKSFNQALLQYQKERFVRVTALREDANLVQRMESLDDPVMRFMALKIVPRLPFIVAFLPQLGSSFVPARRLEHLPPPKTGLSPFSQDMKAKPTPRSPVATLSWVGGLIFAASLPSIAQMLLHNNSDALKSNSSPEIFSALQLYTALMAMSISGVFVVESHKVASLVTPITSAIPWIMAANYWGWAKIVPAYFCLHVLLSQSTPHYFTPQTMTDVGIAKALVPALVAVYAIPVLQVFRGINGDMSESWHMAHCALPVAAYIIGNGIKMISNVTQGVDAVFSTIDMPYVKRFQTTMALVGFAGHLALIWKSSDSIPILTQSTSLLLSPLAPALISLGAVTTGWCLYLVWELRRIKATDTSIARAWALILLASALAGPASTLAGTYEWYKVQLAQATSFQPKLDLSEPSRRKRYVSDMTRHCQ